MTIIMSTAQSDVPGLNLAVEHLQELSDRMRNDFGFADSDVGNIDIVIDALRELEALRSDAHTRLEAETINASIQRHKLQFLPQQITKEITDAVASAKKSNADAIVFLKNQLDKINKNIVYLESYQKQLDEENSKLHPERELIRQQHEEIISQLNQRMAEKASMQIQLNETRDKVRQTNQEIVDLEDGILQLKEDLIMERTEAQTEKRTLKKAVADTTDKTREQKLVNVEKKKELDELHTKLMESEGKLDALRKSLRRYETNKAKLEGQERALTAQLQKQLKQNEELRRKGQSIISEDAAVQREFLENEKQLTNKLMRLQNEIENEESRYYELDEDREQLAEELEGLLVIRAEDAEKVNELDMKLQAEKRNLSSKAEEVGDMQGQNTRMLEEIEAIGETHKAMQTELNHRASIRTPSPPGLTAEQKAMLEQLDEEERAAVMAQMNKQIENYREQLARERKERMIVQERKNSVSKELEDYKLDNQRFMQEMNNTITQGKQDHIALSNEMETVPEEEEEIEESTAEIEALGAQLKKELQVDEEEIKVLEDKLKVEQKKYEESFTRQQKEVDTMEREIIEMENTVAEKKQRIEEYTPEFDDLNVKYEERTTGYEKQKKNIVELKGKKNQLEDQIKKARERKEKMTGPQEKLRHDLKQKRHEVLFQLRHHGEETKNMESDIYMTGCKLKTVLDENNRFQEASNELNKEIDEIQYQMDYNEKLKDKLLKEMEHTKALLSQSWDEDQATQEKFSERDQEVVDELGDLLDRTIEREGKISGITDQLDEELGYLSAFLDNLATRRPKDSYLAQCRTPTPGTPWRGMKSERSDKPLSFRLAGREKTMESGRTSQQSSKFSKPHSARTVDRSKPSRRT